MIRCSVAYPRTAGKRFDLEYYKNNHVPLVKRRLAPIKVEIDAGVPNHAGEPSPFLAVGHMTFETMEQLLAKYAAAAQELHADIPNYTDIEPIIQLSEVIEI
uniref:Ethyl tert-butyl ether degradation EthD n=1 Tax=Geobacter sp. (strain M21) TaxID=443144 RepID=C6E2D0_GEOSM